MFRSPAPRRTAPTVGPTGGGASGGTLTPGLYFVTYTTVDSNREVESYPSPNSVPFTVAAGNIPQVVLPPLPFGVASYNVYLSNVTAQSGSAILYAAGIKSTTVTLPNDPPNGNVALQVNNLASITPVVTVNNNTTASTSWTTTQGGSGLARMAGLEPGTYYVVYTFTYPSGAETFASPPSAPFTVAQGQTAQVTLPPLPPGASGINLYLSDNKATPGSATRYYTGVTETKFDLVYPQMPDGATPPVYNQNPITPRVNVIGGNAYGGELLPGTYYLFYTFVDASGVESQPSPASPTFKVLAGNIPQVSLPQLPPGDVSYNIYLSDPVANPNSATLYAAGVTTSTFNLQRNALSTLTFPTAVNFPRAVATVDPTGGGATGGNLAAGTYRISYSFVNAAGAETFTSPQSAHSRSRPGTSRS